MAKTKLLLVDCQSLQVNAFHRGMGKYLLHTLSAICRLPERPHVTLLFNSNIMMSDERLRQILDMCTGADYVHVNLPSPVSGPGGEKVYKSRLEKYIEANFSSKYKVSYLVNSPFVFDIYTDFPDNVEERSMIFYDLIPLLHWSELGRLFDPDVYMDRFQHILKADKVFCISTTTCRDLIANLGVDEARTRVVDGGYTSLSDHPVAPSHIELPNKFILFPTGSLPHKNNELVMSAFEKLSHMHSGMYMVVTSKFSTEEQSRFSAIGGKKVIFSGYISDDELAYLYENSSFVLFASKYEGLGLPILDAMAYDKPVVVSDAAVFKEISRDAFYEFSMDDEDDLLSAMDMAITKKGLGEKRKNYKSILKNYTWDNTAARLLDGLTYANKRRLPKKDKQTIVIVAPHPGLQDTVGGVCEKLYNHLSQKYKIKYYFDDYQYNDSEYRPTFLKYMPDAEVLPIRALVNEKCAKRYYIMDDEAFENVIAEYAYILGGSILPLSDFNRDNIVARAVLKKVNILDKMI
ncbi:MAG: glycosyltransferase [Candidatus Nomurabacteria bacterium]|jgi:glycosyltransferase involved in cell wall biosynthesis|nr:glycosyltransferase [Candidatus Nomurabacteria bacterium]